MSILALAALTPLACGYTGEALTGRATGPGRTSGGTDSSSAAASVTAFDGDLQTAPAGTPLPDPLVVRVGDAGGSSVEGVVVTWSVISGGGSLASDTSVTNSQGQATNTLTLGDSLGEQTVEASLRSDTTLRVTFTASASDVPVNGSVSVQDTSFAPAQVTVRAGGVVTWTWTGGLVHNIIWLTAAFPDAGDRSTGTHQVAFPSVGTFAYYCSIHGTPTTGMRGSVRVIN